MTPVDRIREPTEANIREVAWARAKVIRARAHELGDFDSDTTRLVGIVERMAIDFAQRKRNPAPTAQAAVAWAITDMHTVDDPAKVWLCHSCGQTWWGQQVTGLPIDCQVQERSEHERLSYTDDGAARGRWRGAGSLGTNARHIRDAGWFDPDESEAPDLDDRGAP